MRKASQLKIFALLALLMAVLLISAAAFGQEQRARGFIELGVRQLWGEVTGRGDLPFQANLYTSKFDEYRDFTNGFFVRSADVSLENLLGKENFLHVQAQSGARKDQAYQVTFERPGKLKFQFRWDQTPHTFSNTAQFLYTQPSPGVFTLPTSIRSQLTAATQNPNFATQGATDLFATLLAGVPPVDLSLRRKAGTVSAAVTPTPNWILGFRFSREKQAGYRPIGTYNPGFEFPEPIDYRTTQIQAMTEYSKQRGGIQFGYVGSIFENKVDSLVWDNAFNNLNLIGATAQGRIDLYPDNTAHNLNLAGAFDVSKSTRVMSSVVLGWTHQNDAFLPFTINPAITTPALPAPSLNGSKQTLAMNYTLVSHFAKHVELSARYRSYDYNNNTPSLLFPSYVIIDLLPGDSDLLPGSSRRMPRQSLPYEFHRKNVELAAVWEFLPKNSLKVGYEFERYDREHRDVSRSDENAFVTSLDLNPNKLTLVRISYRRSGRSPNLYLDNVDNFPLGPELARRQLNLFRRFDEAARVRNRGEASVQFSPLQSLSFSSSYGTIQDKYNESLYGVLRDLSYYYTFDVNYSPRPEFAFFAEYAREKFRTRQRSRLFSCGLAVDCTGLDAPLEINNSANNDWESSNRNVVDTWAVGMDFSLVRRRVVLSTFYSTSASYGSILTRALGDSSLPGFLLDSTLATCGFGGCTAQNYPDLNNRLHSLVASLKFALPKGFSPRLEYRYDRYDRRDWQTQRMRPYMFGIDPDSNTQIFLGADAPSYRAHFLAASLEYRF